MSLHVLGAGLTAAAAAWVWAGTATRPAPVDPRATPTGDPADTAAPEPAAASV